MAMDPRKITTPLKKSHLCDVRPNFDCVALLLQGGGALGAYQAGVYEALAEAGLEPDWLGGISIGAVNAALIAGNAPEHRVARLREFWEMVTAHPGWQFVDAAEEVLARGTIARTLFNNASAALAAVQGAPGFFKPRMPPPWLQPAGTIEATSYYDVSALRSTLTRLVDFDRLNAGPMRFSVGAVNVRSGNFSYFDNRKRKIVPEHVMASGALPPGFPPIEIEGEFYWDGGLVSNTPLQYVLESEPRHDTLAFQVDLWSARGEMPTTLAEVGTRQKEIQYSSRTRAGTNEFKLQQMLRRATATLLDKLPRELNNGPELELLRNFADLKVYNIVQLIYRARHYEGQTKDYEFSRLTMEEHWRAGYNDAVRTLRHPEALERPETMEGVRTFDLAVDSRE
jgi:NTE family protein